MLDIYYKDKKNTIQIGMPSGFVQIMMTSSDAKDNSERKMKFILETRSFIFLTTGLQLHYNSLDKQVLYFFRDFKGFEHIIKITFNKYLKSVVHLLPVMSWLQRELYDMFGIRFINAPKTDLRRILTDYGFRGHPLTKLFPLTGFDEKWFKASMRRIVRGNSKAGLQLINTL
jgi:NADH:ubiquinone oxidoreductase subunit C